MRFVTNRISTKQTSFSQYLDNIEKNKQPKETVKTASTIVDSPSVSQEPVQETVDVIEKQAECELTPAQEKLPEALKNAIKGKDCDKSDKAEDEKEESPKEEKAEDKSDKKSEDKEAKDNSNTFVKIANLDSKTKKWLKAYWNAIHPSGYADAMVSDR